MADKPVGQLKDGRDLPIFIHSELDDLGLKSRTFRVYAHLARRAGRGEAFPSYNSIGEACFKPDLPKAKPDTWRRMAIAAVKELVDAGLIRKETHRNNRGDSSTNTYRLTPSREWAGGGGSDNALPSDNALRGSDNALGSDNAPKGTPFEGTPFEGTPLKAGGGSVRLGSTPPARPAPPTPLSVYQEVFERQPSKAQSNAIIATVTDCDRWRDICTTWALKDFNPGNIADLLDVYANGWKEKHGKHSQHSGKLDTLDARRAAYGWEPTDEPLPPISNKRFIDGQWVEPDLQVSAM
jgi:hypothetical protein